MINYEDQCVGCEICTLGNGCPLKRVMTILCDQCGDDAICRIDDTDLCAECADQLLNQTFDESFTIREKAEMLDSNYQEL